MAKIGTDPDVAGGKGSLLDKALANWHWRERHRRRIDAAPNLVWRAMHEVPSRAIRLSRILMWLRSAGRSVPPLDLPMIDTMPPRPIAADPTKELLLGLIFSTDFRMSSLARPSSIAELDAASGPGVVRVAVNFTLTPLKSGGTLLSTETRAFANDAKARRLFGLYWLAIRLGSGLIRRDILRAVGRHAESLNTAA